MSLVRVLRSLFLSFVLASAAPAQQPSPSSQSSTAQQALPMLRQSLAAQVGNQSITDITLTAAARRIAGSDDESGTATFKALASGASRLDLSLSSGTHTEILNLTGAQPSGSWSGPDGVSHEIAFHNLLTGPAWFFPAFPIARGLSASGYIAAYVGHEIHNGQAVEHVSIYQPAPLPNPPGGATFEHLTQIDFFLDSSTLLPAALAFNIHPDNNALLDIPVEIRFSNYTSVSGAQVPYHVQKYLNNSLILDFQVTSVTLNSGLSASAFSVQ